MIDWTRSIQLEHKVADIITRQEINGVYFNTDKAIEYVDYLEQECDKLYNEIRPLLSKEIEVPYKNPVNKPFLKSGKYTKNVRAWYGDIDDLVGGPFTRLEFVEPDLGSRQKLIKQLLLLGWKPTIYTDPSDRFPNGSPKLTIKGEPVDSLYEITGDLGKRIARWYTYRHRQSQIKGWINNERLAVDHRITAGAIPCGTNTGRMKHNTVVNVPKANADKETHKLIWEIDKQKDIFGTQMRSLFTVPDNKLLVGHDASGLELRMLAHYMNDPEYTEVLLNGDLHTLNQELAGLPTRDDAKTFILIASILQE